MDFLLKKDEFERLDQLIRLEATGNPSVLAAKFNTTERTIYRIINKLKEVGCPIYYNKIKSSYCYKFDGKLVIKFQMYTIENIQLNNLKGGVSKKSKRNLLDKKYHWTDLLL